MILGKPIFYVASPCIIRTCLCLSGMTIWTVSSSLIWLNFTIICLSCYLGRFYSSSKKKEVMYYCPQDYCLIWTCLWNNELDRFTIIWLIFTLWPLICLSCKLLLSFQIIDSFAFSRYIDFLLYT